MVTWRRGIVRIGIVSLILISTMLVAAAQSKTESPGLLDARQWDFSKRLPLKANWFYFENRFVLPSDIANERVKSYIFFPSLWNDHNPKGIGIGYATYALQVLLPDSIKALALEIPQVYSSYNLWVNGNLIASAGKVGERKETVIPQWIYRTVSFSNPRDTLQIVLQLANFHHHKGGAKDPIYLGTSDRINAHFSWAIGSNVIEVFILLLEGIFFLIFFRAKRKPVILYFALLCLTWSVRSVFSNLYPLVLVAPNMNWQLMIKVEYITLYLTAIWASLFFNCFFRDISNPIFTYLPIALNIFFILFTLLTPAIIFSRWVSVYLGVAGFVILYGAAMIIRALIFEREGSWFLMASIGTGVLLFGYDVAAYQSSFYYNVVYLNIGYVLIFLFTTAALLFHLGVFRSKTLQRDFLTYKDLFQLNKK